MLKKTLWIAVCGFVLATVVGAQPAALMEQITKITSSDEVGDDEFGRSVSISGDTAVVGAHGDDDLGSGSGAAYIFERNQGGPGAWGQVAKLTAPDGAAADAFGWSVAIDGDTVVVGAFGDDDGGESAGSAYIFERDQGGPGNWGQVTRIAASDISVWYGYSVSISGDTVLIGAFFDNGVAHNAGAAYIYDRDQGGADNWGEVTKLTASDANASAWFGVAVSISGDTALIGATFGDSAVADVGTAYIFDRNQGGAGHWGEVVKLVASDAGNGDEFGSAVSIDGDTALIGAKGNDEAAGVNAGSAYVFDRDQGGADNWGEVTKLSVPVGALGDLLGTSVFLVGDSAFVGSPGDDSLAAEGGSVHRFDRDQGGAGAWGHVTEYLPGDPGSSDQFGFAIGATVTTAVLGSPFDDDFGGNSGAAYVFGSTAPFLTMPAELPAVSGGTIDVEVTLGNADGNNLTSVAFSIDYDTGCLGFDEADVAPADGIPDGLAINLPATFTAFVFHDLGDTDGEIDVVLFADDPTTTVFTDGVIATATFTATCSSAPTTPLIAPVVFSTDPAPSFGNADAQAVDGTSTDGSVEVHSGVRGDCNADGLVSAPDLTASQFEILDGDGTFWADTLDSDPFLGSPVGCDANADTFVDAGDLSCVARRLFGLTCGGAPLQEPDDGPRLTAPAHFEVDDGIVVVTVSLESGDAAINSTIFSIDYDETRVVFDDLPGAVRFPGDSAAIQVVRFDANDTDGEIDVVIAEMAIGRVLDDGAVVEIDLRLDDPSVSTISEVVQFSSAPAASFGDVEGRSVAGTAELDFSVLMIFGDGFESGDFSGWSFVTTP